KGAPGSGELQCSKGESQIPSPQPFAEQTPLTQRPLAQTELEKQGVPFGSGAGEQKPLQIPLSQAAPIVQGEPSGSGSLMQKPKLQNPWQSLLSVQGNPSESGGVQMKTSSPAFGTYI